MARPRKEGMEYFPHDSYAVNDKKIEALRMLYGNDGYAFYFILLETIYQEPNFELDISDAETIQILIRKTSVTEQKFNSMLETSLKRDCFDRESYENRQVLTSNGIKKRATVVTEKRVKMQESYASKGNKVSDPISDAETTTETPQSKRKVKGKESIKNTYMDFIFLTEKEYENLKVIIGETNLEDLMFELNTWLANNPKKQKTTNCNLTLQNWYRRRKKDPVKPIYKMTSEKEAETQKRLAEERKNSGLVTFQPEFKEDVGA
jgi:hypothetical protein